MDRYSRTTETYLKDNHNIFYEELYTTILIGKYFKRIGGWIQYVYDGKKTQKSSQIINNSYNTVLSNVPYTEPINIIPSKKHGLTSRSSSQRSTTSYVN